ncbi:amidohydrolase [Vibrio sp.]|uniref:amidohydrolase n=1 Tax=Vibrio sp. TaxID=678 RepID=UPI003D10B88E
MKHFTKTAAALLIGAATALSGCADTNTTPQLTADLVLLNGDVYTVDPQSPRVEAFAVKDHKFLALGSSDEIKAYVGDTTQIIDAQGKTVTPGLIDGHTHISEGMSLATGVDLSDIVDQQEWLRIIKDKVATMEPGQWLLGGAWNHLLVPGGQLPTIQMLDSVAPNNPVLLWDIDHHTAWVNSKAFEVTGMSKDSEVADGGIIGLDDNGEVNGILYESAAFGMMRHPSMADAKDPMTGFKASIKLANSLGITSVHDMSLGYQPFLQILDDGDLSLRVWQGAFMTGEPDFIEQSLADRDTFAERMAAYTAEHGDRGPQLELGYIKFMIDGVLSTHTALLKLPYADKPEAQAEHIVTPKMLSAAVQQANKANMPVSIHAIGDRGVAESIDAYASAQGIATSVPNRLEHIELITADDIQRMKQHNIGASMQPRHANCCVGAYVIDRVGEHRTETEAYLWKTMLDNQVELALGSDWPTSPFNPLAQLQDAQTRESIYHDGQMHQWDGGKNALTFEQALHAYTQGAANLTAWKDQIGSITPGKYADFVILDSSLPAQGFRDLNDVSVTSTWLAGEAVYQKPDALAKN